MAYTADYVKEKLSKELEATHVVSSVKRNDTSTTRGFTLLMITIGLLLRWGVALHSYSGQGKSPMYGDYEAQRHWQEITLNLPSNEWYHNTTKNDLNYWGLDYPPLSAYHSYILGIIANKIDYKFVELNTSRGIESENHKLFMRISSIIADILLYIPVLILYFYKIKLNLVLTLIYPGLILIDHGHFQYNSISLGFILAAVLAVRYHYVSIASILFCCAINYKQIALYHSLPFFFYLLGYCFKEPTWIKCFQKLTKIGISVILTFLIIWLPFLIPNPKESLQVLHRMFPVARGLYEDKVASFWCSISIIFKPQRYLQQNSIAILCAVVTLISILPSNFDLFLKPGFKRFILSSFNSSIGFFLFSFHVHEKSILFPALSAITLYPYYPFSSIWFLWISSFSLLPLMVKDDLIVPWIALQLMYLILAYKLVPIPNYKYIKLIILSSLFTCLLLSLGYALINPPSKYPDVFPLLISAFSCLHFLAFMAYFSRVQIMLPIEKLHKN